MNTRGLFNLLEATYKDTLKKHRNETEAKTRLNYVMESPIFELWAFLNEENIMLLRKMTINRVQKQNRNVRLTGFFFFVILAGIFIFLSIKNGIFIESMVKFPNSSFFTGSISISASVIL